jgi:hypothetical protein
MRDGVSHVVAVSNRFCHAPASKPARIGAPMPPDECTRPVPNVRRKCGRGDGVWPHRQWWVIRRLAPLEADDEAAGRVRSRLGGRHERLEPADGR